MLKQTMSQKKRAIYPENLRSLVEESLEKFFPLPDQHSEVVYQAMRHILFSKGKRFRPVLTLLTHQTFGGAPQDVLPAACAIEYIHTYSLIHDDLPAIDDDCLRRGKPTCHIAFGEDIAILAGDALFAEAFYLISTRQQAKEPSLVVRVIAELAEASSVRGMVGGQVVDVLSSGLPVDLRTLDFIHANKTGKLISASVRVGAILARASEEELKALSEYASHLGLAFQITDDILDLTGDEETTGKPSRSDLKKNKATFPALLGLDASRDYALQAIDKAKDALSFLDRDTSALAEIARFVYERPS